MLRSPFFCTLELPVYILSRSRKKMWCKNNQLDQAKDIDTTVITQQFICMLFTCFLSPAGYFNHSKLFADGESFIIYSCFFTRQ